LVLPAPKTQTFSIKNADQFLIKILHKF